MVSSLLLEWSVPTTVTFPFVPGVRDREWSFECGLRGVSIEVSDVTGSPIGVGEHRWFVTFTPVMVEPISHFMCGLQFVSGTVFVTFYETIRNVANGRFYYKPYVTHFIF